MHINDDNLNNRGCKAGNEIVRITVDKIGVSVYIRMYCKLPERSPAGSALVKRQQAV